MGTTKEAPREAVASAPKTDRATKEINAVIEKWKASGKPLSCDDCGEASLFVLRLSGVPYAWWLQCAVHALWVEAGRRAPGYYITTLDGEYVEGEQSITGGSNGIQAKTCV